MSPSRGSLWDIDQNHSSTHSLTRSSIYPLTHSLCAPGGRGLLAETNEELFQLIPALKGREDNTMPSPEDEWLVGGEGLRGVPRLEGSLCSTLVGGRCDCHAR